MNPGTRHPSPRILLYGHDTYGLGHYRRNLTLGRRLSEVFQDGSILCLTGSPCADSFRRPDRFDVVRLPAVTKDGLGHYTSRSLSLSIDQLTSLRRGIIHETIRGFRPDVFLVDHSPVGMKGELREALAIVREVNPGAVILLGLRDIIDDEESVIRSWNENGIYRVLEEEYDRILVYGNREIYDLAERYRIPDTIREKIVYTGYVYRNGAIADPDRVRRSLAPTTGRLVAVTVGGGGDGEEVVRLFLDCLRHGPAQPLFDSVVVTGPLMLEATKRDLQRRAVETGHPVRFVDFDPRVLDSFAAADVIVSMGGYNSLCEILALGKRCVVLPRQFPRKEQLVRSERFAELGLARSMNPRDASPEDLWKVLERELEGAARDNGHGGRPRLDTTGITRAVAEIEDLLEHPPARSFAKPTLKDLDS